MISLVSGDCRDRTDKFLADFMEIDDRSWNCADRSNTSGIYRHNDDWELNVAGKFPINGSFHGHVIYKTLEIPAMFHSWRVNM